MRGSRRRPGAGTRGEIVVAHITKAQYVALAEFRYALRQFLHYSEEAAISTGLTPQQHQALLALKGFPGRDEITIGELAERMQIRHHSAVELADRLGAQGLIRRKTSRVDRRQVRITLTTRGLSFLERLSASHKDELHRIAPSLRRILDELSASES